MKMLLGLLIALLSSGSLRAEPKGFELQAVGTALGHSELRVRYAGLLTIKKLKGAQHPDFYRASLQTLSDIDQRAYEILDRSRPLSEASEQELAELLNWKLKLLEILILEGGELNSGLRRYVRNCLGSDHINPVLAPRIFELLKASARIGSDNLVDLALEKFLSLSEQAARSDFMPEGEMEQATVFAMVSEIESFVVSKQIVKVEVLIRLARLAKSLKIPHQVFSKYIGEVKSGNCDLTINLSEG